MQLFLTGKKKMVRKTYLKEKANVRNDLEQKHSPTHGQIAIV